MTAGTGVPAVFCFFIYHGGDISWGRKCERLKVKTLVTFAVENPCSVCKDNIQIVLFANVSVVFCKNVLHAVYPFGRLPV